VNSTETEASSNGMLCDKYNKYPASRASANVKVTVFWDVTCIMVDRCWRFRVTYCLLLQVELRIPLSAEYQLLKQYFAPRSWSRCDRLSKKTVVSKEVAEIHVESAAPTRRSESHIKER
jgi:hypothetical protein